MGSRTRKTSFASGTTEAIRSATSGNHGAEYFGDDSPRTRASGVKCLAYQSSPFDQLR